MVKMTVRRHSAAKVMATVVSTSLALLTAMAPWTVGEIFTSSDKILDLANRETALLDALQMHIHAEYDNLKALSAFLSERSKATRMVSFEDLRHQAEHPNGAYHLIRLYTQDWHNVVTANPLFDRRIPHLKPHLPTPDDFYGACSAIVRLHRVYKLRVDDMYAGNYSGYLGPPLKPDDAFEIGRQAFVDGFLEESSEWLQLSVAKLEEQAAGRGRHHYTQTKRGQACGLLGRAYYFMNNTQKAREMHDIGKSLGELRSQPFRGNDRPIGRMFPEHVERRFLDPEYSLDEYFQLDGNSGDILQLQKELQTQMPTKEYGSAAEAWHENMTELCMRDKSHRVDKLKPFHICRYKAGVSSVPYERYKEEILSEAPYASVFYDIVLDSEIDALTSFVKGRMFRGLVGMGENATTAEIRTSDLGWVYDDELQVASRLSERVKSMTGLEVAQRIPHGPSSSEAFQIVNYGLGGHYDVHMDPFDHPPDDVLLNRSGERLATFLIYLSDVEKGGHTVFTRSKISVAPQKGMALFWYNFDPTMTKDLTTHHAGCPVIIGHKWIANKWIWTYGNTFRRPCGPTPNSIQRDIEPLMYTRHKRH